MMKSKVGVFLSTVLIVAVSCNKEFKDLSTDSSTTANNEVVSESYSGDVEDLSAVAVSTDPNAGGRELSTNSIDDRFSCATITRTAGAEVNEGTILIDFGSGGCKDSKGNVRKGSIKITYKGKRYAPGSSCKTELIDYSINDLKVEGTREIVTDVTSKDSRPVYKVTLTGGKTTWPDGTFSTHDYTHIRTWYREANPTQDSWTVSGTGKCTSRKGASYEMRIVKDLVYKKSCESVGVFVAVSGIKAIKKDNKDITIDYGNGVCNNLVTVTYNGVSKVIEISKKGW